MKIRLAVVAISLLAVVGLLASAVYAQSAQPIPYIHTIAAGSGTSYTPQTLPGNMTPPNHGTAPGDGYPATDSHVQFKNPTAIAVDGLGNLYISDTAGFVRRVDAATGNITTFAGGIAKGSTGALCPNGTDTIGNGCPANEAYLNGVQGIAIDPRNGDVYLADATDNRIRKIDHATYLISTVVGTGTKGGVDGAISSGTLNSPRSVAVDKYGNVYIGEGSNYDVRAAIFCDPTGSSGCNGPLQGQIVTVVNTSHTKSCTPGMGITSTTTAGATQTGMAKDIAFDKDGNLYVADASCAYVFKVAVNAATKIVDSNSIISILAGTGSTTAGTDIGYQPATAVPIAAGAVKVDPTGNLYIGESQATYPAGSRVWFYDAATGYVHAIFGGGTTGDCFGVPASGTAPYNGCDGIHSSSTAMSGNALALDTLGNLYISDNRGFYVHKLSLGTSAPFTSTTPVGTPNALLHFGAGDGLAGLDASLAPDFAVTQGACATSANADATQDCTATIGCQTGACSDPSTILYQPITVTSTLGKNAQLFVSNRVFPTCQPPQASDLQVALTGSSVAINLKGNLGAACSGIETNPTTPHALSYRVTGSGPSNGTLTGNGASLTYTPNDPASPVADSFKYTVNDDGAWSGNVVSYDSGASSIMMPAVTSLGGASATVSIVIAPKAQNLTVNTFANTDTPINLIAIGNGTLTYNVTAQPANGSLTGVAPNLSYISSTTGDDSFQYTVSNAAGTSTPATVTIHVAAEQVPVPADQTVTVAYETPKTITLSAVGSRTISYDVTNQPGHGSLSGAGATWTYTPASGYIGDDSFQFTATNNLGTSATPGTVTIHVNPPAPVALDQSVNAVQGVATPITLQASGSGTITYTLVPNPADGTVGPSHGSLSGTVPNLTYTSEASYLGPDKFWFVVNNGLESNVATVQIAVTHLKPVPNPAGATVAFNTETPITLTATGSGTITYNITTMPQHGTLTGSGSSWSYKPDLNFAGSDALYYTASNDGGTSTPAKFPITVKGDFSWTSATPGGNAVTANLGDTATFNLLISGWTGATDSVSFVCNGAPMPCTISPNPATLNGTTAVPVTVSVATGNSKAATAGFMSGPGMNGGWPWLLALALGCLTAFVVPVRNRRLQWRMAGAFGLLLMVIVLGSCGVTQSKSWTTPTGQYSMTVTATAGSVSKAYTITLNIK